MRDQTQIQKKNLIVDEEAIAEIVSGWTKIPVKKIEKEEDKKGLLSSVKDKFTNGAKKAGFFFIKGKLESAVNDVICFVGAEAYRVYSTDFHFKDIYKSGDKL